jgi:hypothetical protein
MTAKVQSGQRANKRLWAVSRRGHPLSLAGDIRPEKNELTPFLEGG